jgi:hypothetical protein
MKPGAWWNACGIQVDSRSPWELMRCLLAYSL